MDLSQLPTVNVTEAIALINQSLSLSLPMLSVEGEVSGYRLSQGKWVFFDIKDDKSSLRCFTTVHNQNIQIEDGMMLKIIARPNLHNKYGFSLVIETMTPSGEGSLKRALELTKKKLEAEGLFDPARKRSLPKFPQVIGLVTSEEAAAYTDVLKILRERWPLAKVVLADSYVQGENAPKSLIDSIEKLNNLSQLPDVIIVTRGGGGLEDLMAFNDEKVVRAISASRVPTVVGVGHERDISLAELAADMRATTPTNAAQKATPDGPVLLEEISNVPAKLIGIYKMRLGELRYELINFTQSLMHQVSNMSQYLMTAKKQLTAYNPNNVLSKGYAVVRGPDGRVVLSSKSLNRGDIIDTKLKQGEISSEVKRVY